MKSSHPWPGVLLCALVFSLAYLVSAFCGRFWTGFNPLTPALLAILLGVLLGNAVPLSPALKPGIAFCLKSILRLAIVLIGLQLSLIEVGQLGALGLPVVLLAVLAGLIGVEVLGRLLKLPLRLVYLLAAGTSICGVTAVVSTAPVIEAEEREVAYAVANVALFGLLGTLIYPYLVGSWFGSGKACGLFLGTAIHDTAQVMGAAASYKALSGDDLGFASATVTKMTRNMLLALVIPYFAWRVRRQDPKGAHGPPLLPGFLLGFLALSLLRTWGDYTLSQSSQTLALGLLPAALWKSQLAFWGKTVGGTWLVGLALVAVGLGLKLETFRGLGLRPFALGLGGASLVGMTSFFAIRLLSP